MRPDVAAALPGWIVARLIVLGSLALAYYVANKVDPGLHLYGPRLHRGLLAWDGRWYRRIAEHGYAPLSDESLRFFPLYPLLARALAVVFWGHATPALLVLSNLPALVLGALLHRLCLDETGDAALARRAAWLVALVPPFFVLVMGYAEPLALCLSVACFMALRRRRWGWAAVAGLLAALTRPVGVLLVVPAAIEATRALRAAGAGERVMRAVATLAPVAGAGAFLLWVGARFGDVLAPLHVQDRSQLRGGFQNPIVTLVVTPVQLVRGTAGINRVHAPWIAVLIVLAVVAHRRWPPAFGAFAAVTVAVALSARNLGSFERYGFGAFPIVLAVASVTAAPWAERSVLAVSAALMAGYALVAFMGWYVP